MNSPRWNQCPLFFFLLDWVFGVQLFTILAHFTTVNIWILSCSNYNRDRILLFAPRFRKGIKKFSSKRCNYSLFPRTSYRLLEKLWLRNETWLPDSFPLGGFADLFPSRQKLFRIVHKWFMPLPCINTTVKGKGTLWVKKRRGRKGKKEREKDKPALPIPYSVFTHKTSRGDRVGRGTSTTFLFSPPRFTRTKGAIGILVARIPMHMD